jgi:putative methyltransferase (TIGR04325 family)
MTAKVLLRECIPPLLLRLYHRLRPPRPRFYGVYPSADEAPDESPFASPRWFEMSAQRLARLCADAASDGFLPARPLPPAQTPTVLILNLLSQVSVCRVLDFAGGSGAIYHLIHPYLTHPERVAWDVFDDDRLAELGRRHRGEQHRIRFLKALPEPDARYEVVHINTSLQYMHEPLEALARLLVHRPRYLVLSRLLAGEVPSFVTAESLHGRKAPCTILDARALVDFLAKRGFRLVFKTPASDELVPEERYGPGIPPALRIPSSLHLVFAEERPPDRLTL